MWRSPMTPCSSIGGYRFGLFSSGKCALRLDLQTSIVARSSASVYVGADESLGISPRSARSRAVPGARERARPMPLGASPSTSRRSGTPSSSASSQRPAGSRSPRSRPTHAQGTPCRSRASTSARKPDARPTGSALRVCLAASRWARSPVGASVPGAGAAALRHALRRHRRRHTGDVLVACRRRRRAGLRSGVPRSHRGERAPAADAVRGEACEPQVTEGRRSGRRIS